MAAVVIVVGVAAVCIVVGVVAVCSSRGSSSSNSIYNNNTTL